MRTEQITIYKFDELSAEAQEKAIETIRQQQSEFPDWSHITDSDFLFEPEWKELLPLYLQLGYEPQQTENGSSYGHFPAMFKHSSRKLYFSTDREWYLDCEGALTVNHEELFWLWLGFTMQEVEEYEMSYLFNTPPRRDSTTRLEVTAENDPEELLSARIEAAEEKFYSHMDDVLRLIEKEIEHLTSEEYARELIEINEWEFTEDGSIY